MDCLIKDRRINYGYRYRTCNIAYIHFMDEYKRLLGFWLDNVLCMLCFDVYRCVAGRAGEEEKEPWVLRREVDMLFFLFVAIIIGIHYPIVGICLISPFVILGLVFLVGGIINLIKTEKEINNWRRRHR